MISSDHYLRNEKNEYLRNKNNLYFNFENSWNLNYVKFIVTTTELLTNIRSNSFIHDLKKTHPL